MDFTEYLLRTAEDRRTFEAKMGNKLEAAMKSIARYIDSLRPGAWISYLSGVPERNIPAVIGCICIYIQDYSTFENYVEFNNTAAMIRKIASRHRSPKEIKDYAQYRKEIQNNSRGKQ